MKIKRIFFIIITITVFFATTGCYYKDLSDGEIIVVAENPAQTVVFIESNNGYMSNLRFIVKTKTGDKQFIKEGKYYNGSYTYATIIEDRDFSILNCYEQSLFLSNEDGLQEIKYREKRKWLEDVIISDKPCVYRQNGFMEVIKVVNEDRYILPDDLDIQSGYLKIESTDDSEILTTIKSRAYVYKNEENIHYFEQVIRRTISEKGAKIDEILLVPEVDIVLWSQIDIKKTLISVSSQGSYIYLLDQLGCLRSFDTNTGELFEYNITPSVQAFILYESNVAVVLGNYIYIYDGRLNLLKVHEAKDQVMGITWSKDNSSSVIKYALIENNVITINSLNLDNN